MLTASGVPRTEIAASATLLGSCQVTSILICNDACATDMKPTLLPVQVEVQGIDSKAIKSTYTAFHTFKNGKTTLSCSGILITSDQSGQRQQQEQGLVLAPITCIYPFLQQSVRSNLSNISSSNLLPGVQITVLLRCSTAAASGPAAAAAAAPGPLHHLPAKLTAALQLPYVEAAADQLLTSANSAGGGSWKFGWYLTDQQPLESATSAMMAHLALLTVDITTLWQQQPQQQPPISRLVCQPSDDLVMPGLQQQQQQCPECTAGIQAGLPIAVLGSPFGCLAAHQFHGAVITGVISNTLTSYLETAGFVKQQRIPLSSSRTSESTSSALSLGQASASNAAAAAGAAAAAAARSVAPLFVVDGRCMPGMEGAAVTCRQCHQLLGLLSLPLSNTNSQVELMMAISIQHVAAALAAAAAGPSNLGPLVQAYQALAGGASSNTSSSSSSSSRVLHRESTQFADTQQQHQQHQHHKDVCTGDSHSSIQKQPAYSTQLIQPWPTQLYKSRASNNLSSSGSSGGLSVSRCLSDAQSGVVMVRVGTSWGSGVIMTQSGLVMTNAHLFGSNSGGHSGGSSSLKRHSTFAGVRLTGPLPNSSSSSSSSVLHDSWLPARLVYRFEGYLDIAILQIQHTRIRASMGGAPGAAQQQHHNLLHPLQLASPCQDVKQGDQVYVIGHGLFGPGMTWPPAVTGGCVARVVYRQNNSSGSRSSSSIKASMLISTAAVHGGASGGALINTAGQLVGLVTSNARHARGATLPHCNFCIAADELRPIWQWAQQQQQQQQQQQTITNVLPALSVGSDRSNNSSAGQKDWVDGINPQEAKNMLHQLEALDLKDAAGTRLWALLPPSSAGQQRGSRDSGTVAAAIDRLNQKLQSRKLLESKL